MKDRIVTESFSLAAQMADIGKRAKEAAHIVALTDRTVKDHALIEAAKALRAATAELVEINRRDLLAGTEKGLSAPLQDRLRLDPRRIEAMAQGIETIAAFPDPVGTVVAEWERPNGLRLQRVRTPLGVVGVIYESRPNVAADAAALCLKSGNAVILRGGKESFHSSRAILKCLHRGLEAAGLPCDAAQMLPTASRDAVGLMLRMDKDIDVLIPRGGKSLVARVVEESRIPLLRHLDGLCHTYIHAQANPALAVAVTVNAKMRRTGICGATETLLIDRAAVAEILPPLASALIAKGCELRGDAEACLADSRISLAADADWDAEYLDAILSVRVVSDLDEAIAHIRKHASGHTEAILTEDPDAAARFMNEIDSAILLWNASTQFADGGEFGMGAEIGIATGKLHARGPVGLEQLTTFKYKVFGSGQCRP